MTASPDARANLIDLDRIDATMIDTVGGKALGLGRMITAGERVPDGFCVTTEMYRHGALDRDAVLQAYRRLGSGPVAVRSSATAEDLDDASFAGQQDTYLDVEGDEALITAIDDCWKSLDSDRAVAYRRSRGWGGREVAMAVVVQRMVRPRAAGVLFTANPITGTRKQMIIDAVPGLGDVLVDGSTTGDHYLLTQSGPDDHAGGCLSTDDLDQLRAAGNRVEELFGRPQDVEWAIDTDGVLWLLQSRAITTLYPIPAEADPDDLRVYLEAGHVQGLHRPATPMGMSALLAATDAWLQSFGLPDSSKNLVNIIGGRLYIDLTDFIRSPRMRPQMVDAMSIYGPTLTQAMRDLLDDPRLAPRKGDKLESRVFLKMAATLLPRTVSGMVFAAAAPAATRRRIFRIGDRVRAEFTGPGEGLTVQQRVAQVTDLQLKALGRPMMQTLPPLWTELAARALAERLLKRITEPGEIDSIGRGMPYNVTTEMDLRLWSIAADIEDDHRELLLNTPPQELARRYLAGDLPDIGVVAFLADYGLRGTAEVDLGSPRWEDDPTPVFAALAGYLRVTDPEQAPDVRFARAAAEAEEALDRLVGSASRTRPVRAALAGWLLRRWRALAGLREFPKFLWLYALRDARRELLLAGEELARCGKLAQAEDIMLLTLDEAVAAADGTDHHRLVEQRRAEFASNERLTRVPGLLLSDGTMPEALPDTAALAEPDPGRLVGVPAAAGRATGTVRVVRDPSAAEMQPGEILVAAATDPGWTPLFLTIAGLVTETGSAIAHGPTVAREYGIPAVICVPGATTRLRDGQRVVVDGASGTVTVLDDEADDENGSR